MSLSQALIAKEDARGGASMFPSILGGHAFTGSVLAGLIWATPIVPAAAQQKAPDFSSNQVGWISLGGDIMDVPGARPGIVRADPTHPYVPNGTGAQPTYRIADLTNPNLKPWVKERMKKDNNEVLAGKIAFTPRSSCRPAGVPGFMSYGRFTPVFFIQSPTEVLIIFESDQQIRRVYLDVPHSESPQPSWYGESVGHYEGETLVIDTIGLNDKTFVDNFRTPHTEKLHVVERWRVIDGGKVLEVNFTVDDPDAFYEPWSAIQRYGRVQQPLREDICAENNQHLFDYHIPVADRPDF
jgi:hypothetical protein